MGLADANRPQQQQQRLPIPDRHAGCQGLYADPFDGHGVVERCANLEKCLVTLLDQVFPEFATYFSDPHGPTARALLTKAPSARLLSYHTAKAFTVLVRKASHGRLGLERVQDLLAAAKASIAATRNDPANELAIRMTIQEIDVLEEQIGVYDREIQTISVAGRDLITTIPGIADVLGSVILAEIGDIIHRSLHPAGGRPAAHRGQACR